MLSNSDIDALEDILFAEPWGEDAWTSSAFTASSAPAWSARQN